MTSLGPETQSLGYGTSVQRLDGTKEPRNQDLRDLVPLLVPSLTDFIV